MDDQNHGTHVSGTIGAVGNNGIGVVGVNWTARLMAIKFLDAQGSGTTADAIAAVEFAIAVKQAFAATGGANIRVLSNSWGGPEFSQALLDQVNAANAADMLFVAGAGNDGFDNDILPFYPASFDAPNVISVASTGYTDDISWFSNYGATSVDLGAPGEDILSTTIGNSYDYASGTSMATPHVAGAAALVLSFCDLSTAALKDTLLGSSDPLPSLEGITVSGGRLNVNNALHACTAPPDTPAGLTARGADTKVTLSWSGALGAMRYNVRRSLTAGGPYSPLASAVKATGYTDSAVVNGTTYYYVVSAENTLGESGDSNEASATPNIPPDMVVSSFTGPAVAAADSTIAISVATKNQGAGNAQPSTTRFYLSDNSALDAGDVRLNGEQAVPELAAGAVSTASVSLAIPADATVGRHYLIASVDDDDVLDESKETNNRLARQLQIGPDLVVSAFTSPAAGAAGGTISVTDTVKNQGGGDAGVSSTTFFLSANSTIGAGDVLLAASRDVPALAVGATSAGTTVLTIPPDTQVGSYYIVAKADGHDAVDETTETNNTSWRAILIGSDLMVSALTIPGNGAADSTIVVTDTTKNQGGAVAPASVTRFYLSVNATLDSGDTLLAGSRDVSSLDPAATSSGSTTVVIPAGIAPGAYYIVAKADADGAVPETSETNNTYARAIQIGSDLVVAAITMPAAAGAGTTIIVGDTTTNQGGAVAAASITRFYLSVNSTLDGGDVLLSGVHVVPDLAGGATDVGSTSLTIPADTTTGLRYIIAKADADNVVIETKETNNTLGHSIQIGPDLVASAFAAPTKGGAGISLTVSDTTVNQGGGSAGPTVTKFYLSLGAGFDINDTLVGSRAVPDLAAGAASSGPTTVTIPPSTAAGAYYLIARADADTAVAETQEANNTTARAIQIGSDLVVSTIGAPAKGAAGSSIVVTDTVVNQGGGGATGSVTRFYLSADGTLDAGDVLLDGSHAEPDLAAGASSAGSTSVTVPAGTAPGTSYIIAKADADGTVAEAVETNNTRSRSIGIGPDLMISTMSVSSASVPAGALVNVTETVTNQGAEIAAASTTRFYLSQNSTLDGSDVALAPGRSVPDLAGSASNSGTTPVTIPLGTVPGSFYVLAKADGDGVVGESVETNNVTARAIQVTAAP
jgi:subtilase family serine protease